MAKVAFSKLNISKDYPIETLNFNNEVIEIKKYLPINEKLELITNVLVGASEDARFYNDVKVEVLFINEVVKYYTNINFSKKQLEKPDEMYDLLMSSGLYNQIFDTIGKNEVNDLYDKLMSIMKSIYAYENSIYAILNNLSENYKNLNLDAKQIGETLTNKEGLEFLKEVMDKLG